MKMATSSNTKLSNNRPQLSYVSSISYTGTVAAIKIVMAFHQKRNGHW